MSAASLTQAALQRCTFVASPTTRSPSEHLGSVRVFKTGTSGRHRQRRTSTAAAPRSPRASLGRERSNSSGPNMPSTAAAAGSAAAEARALTSEFSALANKEVVLFLFQLDMDTQLQRALTYEDFDAASEIRARRHQVDQAVKELQQVKGAACGVRKASRSDEMEYAPQILLLKSQMAAAVAQERYDDAAALRDRLRTLEEKAASAACAVNDIECSVDEPRYMLGEMVVHNAKGYRGVICGWDLACCESPEWQAEAGVDKLENGAAQVFYQVLVDTRDWPVGPEDTAPVAYVAEELLSAASSCDFSTDMPLVDGSFVHPYSYLLFLGADGQGDMIPCRQLRDKYNQMRRDVYAPGESRWEEDEESDDDSGPSNGGSDGGEGGRPGPTNGSGGDSAAGWTKIPGIDMSSLE